MNDKDYFSFVVAVDEKDQQEDEQENELVYLPGYDEIMSVLGHHGDCLFRIAIDNDGLLLVSCSDVLSFVGRVNAQRQFVKKFVVNTTGTFKDIQSCYGIQNKKVVSCESKKIMAMNMSTIRLLICFHIQTARSSTDEKEKLYEQFQLDDVTFKTPFLPSVENETLSHICRALPFKYVLNMRVGSLYRVDCYFPDIKVVLECDEYNHKAYDKLKEEQRQLFIQKELSCIIIRYNPHAEKFNILDVIRSIIFKMLTPEYEALVYKVINLK